MSFKTDLGKFEKFISENLSSHSLLNCYDKDLPPQGKLAHAGLDFATTYQELAPSSAALKNFAFCEWVLFMSEIAIANGNWDQVSSEVESVIKLIADEETDGQAFDNIDDFSKNWEYATYEDDYGKLYTDNELREQYVRWYALATLLYVYQDEFLSILTLAKKRYERVSGATANTKQENTMSATSKLVETNKALAITAATLEAGRIANNKAAKLLAKKMPVMVRGYAETAVGKLVIANLVKMGLEHFKPDNKAATAISNAMIQQAYVEILQEFDIEGFLDGLLSDKTLMSKAASIAEEE